MGVYFDNDDVKPGEALLHVDSYGQIAIAVREGRADELLSIFTGRAISLCTATQTSLDVQGIASAK